MITEPQRYMLVAKVYSYQDRHPDAVRVLSDGIARHPDSGLLYRHRGHFKVSIRDFAGAVDDFRTSVALLAGQPDEIEYYQAELMPEVERLMLGQESELLAETTAINAANLERLRDVYKGTLQSSAWYHYGLAHYLRGEYDEAADKYRKTLELCVDDDMTVATTDWLYMSLRRAGRHDEAAELLAATDLAMHINEPSYYRRMEMYKGVTSPETVLSPTDGDKKTLATQGYGVGNWYYYNGRHDEARAVFERILAVGHRAAFGTIAAEVDLARMGA
ncbi:MAG TPA: tetratricopeptide repeat protein [Trueperaceae bacterium]|nr:tetratricopeptide repeat protein [Trueperaceae bacterium]HRP45910.1 tetratricopeptide repeat protein [Trueperaceae bacterium]